MNRDIIKQKVEANLTSNRTFFAQMKTELGDEIFTRLLSSLPEQKRRYLQ